MKLPSVEQVYREAGRTARRFPFVLLSALCWTIASVMIADHEGPAGPSALFPMLFASSLGMLLLLALSLTAEKRKWGRAASAGSPILAVLLLVGYAFTVPTDLTNAPAVHGIRFSVLLVGLALLVMVAPYLKRGDQNGFWHYNRALYFRLFITGLYAAVLFAGLAIALAALDNLFGVDVPEKRYFELWVLIVGLFAPWFFLAGVPEDFDALEKSQDYPKGLRVFAQYILLTLVLVYLVILYAYLAKILIQWNWPKGWVSSLILGFSATAIAALLLLYPIRERAGNAWVTAAGRWLYIVLIPLIVVLFLAVTERVSDYGITESRYAGIALGIWLSAQVMYFLLSKTKSIKFTVGSLCALAFAISAGPWGMFAVSERSQVGRLQELLARNDILIQGNIQKVTTEIPEEERQQISSIVDYLRGSHGYGRIQTWFAERLQEDTDGGGRRDKSAGDVVQMMGFEFTLSDRWSSAGNRLERDPAQPIDLVGYDKLAQQGEEWQRKPGGSLHVDGLRYRISAKSDTLTFELADGGLVVDSVAVDLIQWKRQLLGKFANVETAERMHLPPEEMAITAEGARFKAKAYPRSIYVNQDEQDTTVNTYDMVVLYSTTR
jgi:hypothetical protein